MSSLQDKPPRLAEITPARIYLKFSANNTIVNLTDARGNCIACFSAGACGFKGAKKGSLLAAQKTAAAAAKKAREQGISQVTVFVKGARDDPRALMEVFEATGVAVREVIFQRVLSKK